MLTKSDIEQIGSVIENKLEPVKKDLKSLKRKVNKIDKTLDVVVKNYDEGDVRLERRVRKIEQHLSI